MKFPNSANTHKLIELAIVEDNKDLTSLAIFNAGQQTTAKIIAKQEGIICGLPLIELICDKIQNNTAKIELCVQEGAKVKYKDVIAKITAPTAMLMQAERIILNFITHLSGVASLTYKYVEKLNGTGVTLLDTRKTLPAYRELEKYAVRVAGGKNHRLDLAEMLMLKDNHNDAAGGITKAYNKLISTYNPCPPIEIECRNFEELSEALALKPNRIMLDNFSLTDLQKALPSIPLNQEVEISGNVNLDNIYEIATCSSRRANYISVGRITHSAPILDLSMLI